MKKNLNLVTFFKHYNLLRILTTFDRYNILGIVVNDTMKLLTWKNNNTTGATKCVHFFYFYSYLNPFQPYFTGKRELLNIA